MIEKKYENVFYQLIEALDEKEKNKAIKHSLNVSSLCAKKCKTLNLDEKIGSMMGLFHDIGLYVKQKHKLHAFYSSEIVKEIFKKYPLDVIQETIIANAIKNHSSKEIENDRYSEILKWADIVDKYQNEKDAIKSKDEMRIIKEFGDE